MWHLYYSMQFVPLFTIVSFVQIPEIGLAKNWDLVLIHFFCKAQIASLHVQDENGVYQGEDLPKSQGNEKIIL